MVGYINSFLSCPITWYIICFLYPLLGIFLSKNILLYPQENIMVKLRINMLTFRNRKLQQVRGSFFVPLPPEWIRSNEMKKSDPVRIVLLDDGNLQICPVPQSGQGSKGHRNTDNNDRLRRCAGFGYNDIKR